MKVYTWLCSAQRPQGMTDFLLPLSPNHQPIEHLLQLCSSVNPDCLLKVLAIIPRCLSLWMVFGMAHAFRIFPYRHPSHLGTTNRRGFIPYEYIFSQRGRPVELLVRVCPMHCSSRLTGPWFPRRNQGHFGLSTT